MAAALTIVLLVVVSGTGLGPTDDSLTEVRARAAERLTADLAAVEGATDAGDRAAKIRIAAGRTLEVLEGRSRLAQRLRVADLSDPRRAESTLRSVLAALTFRVVREAEVPVGFPEPTLVGEIEIKEYPAYRLARADMSGRGMVQDNLAFWTLFRHIEKHSIPMTAPVEMSYGDPSEARPRTQAMAFLYSSRQVGELGEDGKVEVVDVAPTAAVSLGMRGDSSQARITAAREALVEWLRENPSFERAGDLRVLGYNGPSVRGNQRYFEVQIPVRSTARSEWL